MPDHGHDHGHGHGGCGHGAAGKAGEEMGLAYSLYQVSNWLLYSDLARLILISGYNS